MNDVTVTLTYSEREAREVARAIHYFDSNVSATYEDHDRMGLIASAIQRALPPPKPDEPLGLGAVVVDADGGQWVRIGRKRGNVWYQPHGKYWRYMDINAVKVLSEGVTE